ncbi:metallophosphoesterase [Leifsonia sp. ZF2019]|uniref:metallophosphoesterase n=1 Tax=Leifsonia sp. ZF2019 TaxID=2781978 RepID=UPI001CBEAD23|nr:metallophosphoesterase [Leifsonia sp. ZF2019]UAJ79141.1 metallophosphoesterase [Leifsonia sp. ZF2019]
MTASHRILHLSDTHLFGDGTLHYGLVDTRIALERVLERAGSLGAVDAVVVSGDLSDDGSAESYRILSGMLEPWAADRGAQVVYAIGNHDLPEPFEEVLGERETVVEVRGLRIVTVDSTVTGAGYGSIDEEQLERLREVLSESAEHGTVVVLHHPPTPPTTGLFESLRLVDPDPLLEACRDGDVRAILAGHYHHALATETDPGYIPLVVAPAVANTVDVLWSEPGDRAVRGSGFAVVDLPDDEPVRAHFVTAPAGDDGDPVYVLSPADVERIAEASGWRGEG